MAVQAYWLDGLAGNNENSELWTAARTGPLTWTAKQKFYSCYDNPPTVPSGFDPTADGIEGLSVDQGGVLVSLDDASATGDELYYIRGNNPAQPPVAIDTTNEPDIWDYFSIDQGIWTYNGAKWAIGKADINGSAIGVFKSVDGGVTWAIQDAANAPSPELSNQAWALRRVDGDNLIRVIWSSDRLTWNLREFDMNPGGGWGTDHDPLTLVTPAAQNQAQDLSFTPTNGDVQFFYITGAVAAEQVWVAVLSGGTWGAPVQVSSAPASSQPRHQCLALDPDGLTLHEFWYEENSNPNVFVYQQIQAGGVLGPSYTFPSGVISSDGFGIPRIESGVLLAPADHVVTSDVEVWPSCWEGSPLSSPVFTEGIIDNASTDLATCVALVSAAPPTAVINVARQSVGGAAFQGGSFNVS
jgi:hypothetical protein